MPTKDLSRPGNHAQRGLPASEALEGRSGGIDAAQPLGVILAAYAACARRKGD